MTKYLLLSASLLALPSMANDDFGIWTEASFEKNITKKFSVDAGVEFRSDNNTQRASRWAGSLGISYKVLKHLSFGAGYVFIHDYSPTETSIDYEKDSEGNIEYDDQGRPEFNGLNVDHGFWRNKHRATFDISSKVKCGRFTLAVRERYQYTHYLQATTQRDRYRDALPEGMKPENWTGQLYPLDGYYFTELKTGNKVKKAKNKHYLRSRFQLEYDIRNLPLTPCVSYEFTNNLADKLDLEKCRLIAGVDWKVTKQHRLNLSYIYEHGADSDFGPNLHVLSIGYKLKF